LRFYFLVILPILACLLLNILLRFASPNLSNYDMNTSAVPQELVDAGGVIVLPYHEDRWYYVGPQNLEINQLKAAIQDTTNNWEGFTQDNGNNSGAANLTATAVTSFWLFAVTLIVVAATTAMGVVW
jgi:hypothetical protein